jgi:CMP/dCMP kinase
MAYRNITISGFPGGGSTTLLNALKEELKFEGWTGFSGGEFMRAYAAEQGLLDPASGKLHHSAEAYGEEFDREVDYGMRSRLEESEGWILESWLSGFMAQGVPDVLKIMVLCSDDAVRVDRIMNRDGVTPEQAVHNMRERYEKNLAKWSRMYAKEWSDWVVATGKASQSEKIDFWKPDLYDIVIDTYSTNKQDTLEIVLNALYASRENASPLQSTERTATQTQ